ncbi:hypothetical protein GFV12_05190 [Desulfurobacterium thermolithotrophum]|uniref:hypothetical protein n=1 Tax=Desulfurobacterium thermolithotrophum TaxID=64160 RepID=UPI0013D1A15B|nr:hypothetical protein [Desulfurobacterium thermolithotrophum]
MSDITSIIGLIDNGGWVAVGVFLGFFIQRLDRRMGRLENKLEAIREEFVSREEHYRDISGWRGEINRLDLKIDRLMEKILEGKK